MKRHLWTDDVSGTVTYFHDIEDGKFGIEQVQDVEAIIDENKRQFNDAPDNWKGEYHHVASIPLVLANKLKQEGRLDDWPSFKKWLSDPDNRFFRVKGGNL